MGKDLKPNTATVQDQLYQEELLDENDAAMVRADLRDPGALYFYSNNALGRFLALNNIVTHPIIKEKELVRKKIARLEKGLLDAGIVDSPESAKLISEVEPDFLPKTENQINVEMSVDRSIDMIRSASIFSDQYAELAKHDFVGEFEKEMSGISDQAKCQVLRVELETQLPERQYVFLRDKILAAMVEGSYRKIFRIIKAFYQAQGWSFSLSFLLKEVLGPKLFADPKFQSAATQHLIRELVNNGHDEFYSLAEYLSELGLNLHQNRLKNAPAAFVSNHLEYLWNHNPHRYFVVIDELLLNGLTTPELLNQDKKVRLRTLQFLLYSFRKGKFRSAMSAAAAVISDQLKMFAPEELSPDRERIIWTSYRNACFELNHEIDPELKKLYRQGRINRFGQEEDDQ